MNQWFYVGANSGCLAVNAGDSVSGGVVNIDFAINDDNLGDNAAGPLVTIKQWW